MLIIDEIRTVNMTAADPQYLKEVYFLSIAHLNLPDYGPEDLIKIGFPIGGFGGTITQCKLNSD